MLEKETIGILAINLLTSDRFFTGFLISLSLLMATLFIGVIFGMTNYSKDNKSMSSSTSS